ncbi:MAG: DNA-binding response regulator [Candidatus Cloacimonadota bacterium]|nr:MAG: DNA-binding response regulator [Candidatus Cloacimonadota bacterium]
MIDKILLLEDDLQIQKGLSQYLESEGFELDIFESLESVNKAEISKYSCLLIDWNLSDGVGIDYIRKVREKNSKIAIILLSARSNVMDKIIGLEIGADDYIVKPYEPRELLARIRAQIRKTQKLNEEERLEDDFLCIGDFKIIEKQRKVIFKESEVKLAKVEYDLLLFLIRGIGKVFSRDEILSNVWGYSFPTTRTVDTHIQKLRKKFGSKYFQTMHGVGYIFDIEGNNDE